MITDPHYAPILYRWRHVFGFVDHDRRLRALDDMDRDMVRLAQCQNLRLASPHPRVTHGRAIAEILLRGHQPIFVARGWEEGYEFVDVIGHVIRSLLPRVDVARLRLGYDTQERQLISDGRE